MHDDTEKRLYEQFTDIRYERYQKKFVKKISEIFKDEKSIIKTQVRWDRRKTLASRKIKAINKKSS